MTRTEMWVRLLIGIILMGLLTLVTDVIADLIQAASTAPVKDRIKTAALRAAAVA
jgi:hypothetical protein